MSYSFLLFLALNPKGLRCKVWFANGKFLDVLLPFPLEPSSMLSCFCARSVPSLLSLLATQDRSGLRPLHLFVTRGSL